jgi:hypothetical protein
VLRTRCGLNCQGRCSLPVLRHDQECICRSRNRDSIASAQHAHWYKRRHRRKHYCRHANGAHQDRPYRRCQARKALQITLKCRGNHLVRTWPRRNVPWLWRNDLEASIRHRVSDGHLQHPQGLRADPLNRAEHSCELCKPSSRRGHHYICYLAIRHHPRSQSAKGASIAEATRSILVDDGVEGDFLKQLDTVL